jgi:hypothetical protein
MSGLLRLHLAQPLVGHLAWAYYGIAGVGLAVLGFGPGALGLSWAILALVVSKLRHVGRIPADVARPCDTRGLKGNATGQGSRKPPAGGAPFSCDGRPFSER